MRSKLVIKSVKLNALQNIIYSVTNIIFPLVTYPYVSRVLSSSGIGQVSFFSSISNYCIMLAGLGISTYGVRAIAKVRENNEKLTKTVKELLFINLIATVITIVGYIVLVFFSPKLSRQLQLSVINGIIIITAPLGMNWLFSGLEQYEYITKRTIFFKTFSIILVYLLVHEKRDLVIYALILAIANIGTYIYNAAYSRHFVDYSLNVKLNCRKHIKPMLILFASTLAISVYVNLDTVMLGFIRDDHQVGLYTTAVKVKTILLSVVNAISIVLLPRLSYYISENKLEEYKTTLKKSISLIVFITVPLAVYFIIEAKDCIYLLGGEDYLGAIPCMQVLMPILIISGFSNIIGNQILIPKGRDSCFMFAVTVGAIVDIVLNIFLIPKMGCVGAAIATLIAEMVQMSIQLFFARKDIFQNLEIIEIIKILFSSLVSLLLVAQVNLDTVNSILSLFITAILFCGIYIFIMIAMKEKYLMQVIALTFNKIMYR